MPKLAKSNRAFSIEVERGTWVETSLRCHPWYGTRWWSTGLTKEDKWSAFRKLQPVFQKRNRRWSTKFHSLSSFEVIAVAWLASLVPVLAYPLYKFMPRAAVVPAVLLWLGTVIALIVAGTHHTTLTLRHSWDPSPFRQYVKEKIVPVIVGALLGILGTLLVTYLRHKYWP